jgi:hypothetical protein
MVRRRRPTDPLLPLPQPTWLVVRNVHRQALESRQLRPSADLRAILGSERDQRAAAGWACEDIGRVCSFFFAVCDGQRVQVGIERYDPDGPGHPAHSG